MASSSAAPERSERKRFEEEEALPLLQSIYLFNAFRDHQVEALHAFVNDRRDVVAELPTGAGKSLIFELSALVLHQRFLHRKRGHASKIDCVAAFPESRLILRLLTSDGKGKECRPVVFVLGPLRDVLAQQTIRLRSRIRESANRLPRNSPFRTVATSFRAGLWTSTEEWTLDSIDGVPGPSDEELLAADQDVLRGAYALVLTTPEKVESRSTSLALAIRNGNLRAFVVLDEVDVISEWRSFRPAYRRLAPKTWSQGAPILALTGTLPPLNKQRIIRQLHLNEVVHIRGGVDRPLTYELLPTCGSSFWHNYGEMIQSELENGGKVLCFCETPLQATEAALEFRANLRCQGMTPQMIQASHAILDAPMRRRVVQRFDLSALRLVFSTAVLCRGLDVERISLVIVSYVKTVSQVMQCCGRAARTAAADPTRRPRCVISFSLDSLSKTVCEANARWEDSPSILALEKVALQRFLLSDVCVRRGFCDYFESKDSGPTFNEPRSQCCSVCRRYATFDGPRYVLVPPGSGEAAPGFADLTSHVRVVLEIFSSPHLSLNDAAFMAEIKSVTSSPSDSSSADNVLSSLGQQIKRTTKAFWIAFLYFLESCDVNILTRPQFPSVNPSTIVGVIPGSRRLTGAGEQLLQQLRCGWRWCARFNALRRPKSSLHSRPQSLQSRLGLPGFKAAVDAVQTVAHEHGLNRIQAALLFPFFSVDGTSAGLDAQSSSQPDLGDVELQPDVSAAFPRDLVQLTQQRVQTALQADAARQAAKKARSSHGPV